MKTTDLLPLLLLFSCTKSYEVEYRIDNESDRSLSIVYQRPAVNTVDSNFISGRKSLVILVEMGDTENTTNYASMLTLVHYHAGADLYGM